jgi:hypothetical protein
VLLEPNLWHPRRNASWNASTARPIWRLSSATGAPLFAQHH